MQTSNARTVSDDRIIHEAFEQQAELSPDSVAISFQDEQINYRDLNSRSNQLAHALLACGLQRNQPVAIMLEDGPRQVESLIAVIKAGGTIVCLDPEHPTSRLRNIVDQTLPPVAITEKACQEQCRSLFTTPDQSFSGFLLVENDDISFAQAGPEIDNDVTIEPKTLPTSNPGLRLDPNDQVYIVYTSGSTGSPKGIVQSHRSFYQFIEWQSSQFGICAPQRFAQWASVSYDAGYRQIFGTLCFGATLCMAPSSVRYNPLTLVDWVDTERISILNVVPSFCTELVKVLKSRESSNGATPLPHLEQLLLSGEVLPVGLARTWLEMFPKPVRLFNLYGPSECILACFCEVDKLAADEHAVPIGNAIAGREILILDKTQTPCAIDAIGEIYVRSDYLTLGYLGLPDETGTRFVQNPCHNDYPDPVYRTGDLGRWRSDGLIDFIGRRDCQVKLRGMRIEPGEIEVAMQGVSEIASCAVVVQANLRKRKNLIAKDRDSRKIDTSDEQQVLVAYFTATSELAGARLREMLAERLPAHMIPQQFVQLPEMPVNANRKLDRKALMKFDYTRLNHKKSYVAPRNRNEIEISAIYAEVLGLERVSIADSFFELGGDSLLAMQVLNRIRRVASAKLSFRDLLDNQTIGEIAELVEKRREPGAPEKPVTRIPAQQSELPLTLAQQAIWFLWHFEPESPYYTGQGTLHLNGELDLPVMQEAWSALLSRHQILRVQFGTKDGRPTQTFDETRVAPLDFVDLTELSADEQWQVIEKAAADKTKSALNLERDRLFQGELFKLSENEHQLLLSFHEIVLDLWGLSILVKDLNALYQGLSSDGIAPLPDSDMSFGEYALWEQQNIKRNQLREQETYWREQLAGELPVLQLPTDRPRPITPSYRGASHSIVLSVEESRNVRRLANDHGATLFMTLLVACNILLRAYSGQDDIIIGAPIANRTHEGAEELAGFFLNMLPLRTRFDSDPSFSELSHSVRETVTGAICNADYPFMWMLEDSNTRRDTSVTPVFQVMFNMLNLPQASSQTGDLEITYNEIDTPYIKYDLCFYSQEQDDQIYLELSYLTDLFDEGTAARILENFRVLLQSLAANPKSPISELNILSETEKTDLLVGFNDTDRNYGNELCIHQLFENQVLESPDDIAFIFRSEQITFAELNSRSNRLAHYLRAAGVERGTTVAICLERGLEMIVGLLAIMKAGGIYVALDPEYPRLRLNDMLVDTGARLLLLQEHTDQFDEFAGSRIFIDRDWAQISEQDAGNPDCLSEIGDILNIVYTSSTTGAPKGVLINMDAVLNRLFWMWDTYPLESGSVALLQKSYSLVAATWEIFGALLKGFPTVILTRDELLDSTQLWHQLVSNKVTHLLASPAVIEGVLTEAENHPGEWDSLRLATTSAEPIAPAMVRRWQNVFPETPLLNLYGSTECSSNVTQYDTRQLAAAANRVPIGKPIANTRVYILDKHSKLAPLGAVGEMCVSGACLAREYLNNPELSNQHFIPDPFSGQPESRLYKTGDLARYQSDGTIVLLGRADRQVNIRGFRVELSDVESALLQHDSIQKCAVILRQADSRDACLAAYLVTTADLSNSVLRAFLRDRLPDYMVPVDYIFLDALPLTPAGKIDSRSLPAPDDSRPDLDVAYVAPGTPTESSVASIWMELLNLDDVGVHDDFFDLGGHSLLASTMLFRLRDMTAVEVPLRVLFAAPSVAALANHIDALQYADCAAANDPLGEDREEIVL